MWHQRNTWHLSTYKLPYASIHPVKYDIYILHTHQHEYECVPIT